MAKGDTRDKLLAQIIPLIIIWEQWLARNAMKYSDKKSPMDTLIRTMN